MLGAGWVDDVAVRTGRLGPPPSQPPLPIVCRHNSTAPAASDSATAARWNKPVGGIIITGRLSCCPYTRNSHRAPAVSLAVTRTVSCRRGRGNGIQRPRVRERPNASLVCGSGVAWSCCHGSWIKRALWCYQVTGMETWVPAVVLGTVWILLGLTQHGKVAHTTHTAVLSLLL